MKIAVLSGKGGAGKTFVTVNLAAVCPGSVYVDCDVEEPNGRIFLKPQTDETEKVYTKIPQFDEEKCICCRKCINFCNFNALVFIKKKPMVFSDICHSCGGCALVCPANAISEADREVGKVESGKSQDISVVTGILNLGEASAVPVINASLEKGYKLSDTVFIDCPPGSSCSVMESVKDADYCIIVAEPTAFGFHNFKTVYKLAELLGKKIGVVINKSEDKYNPLTEFCKENNSDILLDIPFDRKIAKSVSEGNVLSRENKGYTDMFKGLLSKIRSDVK